MEDVPFRGVEMCGSHLLIISVFSVKLKGPSPVENKKNRGGAGNLRRKKAYNNPPAKAGK